MLSKIRSLQQVGVIGINCRNGDFIERYNPRRLFPLVDDKVRTKQLAMAAGIAVPELYDTIETPHDIRKVEQLRDRYTDFVIKPAQGSGGDGILVVTGHSGKNFRRHNGLLVTPEEVSHYLSNILSGQYSLGGHPDKAMVEYRVVNDPIFDDVAYQGIPDIRIIVFQGYPVMAMIRLPTRQSQGKANLHQGAIGVGIDLGSGRTLGGVHGNSVIANHPDTGSSIRDLEIPEWNRLLTLAARCFELSGLGYLGVDIVLDRNQGPLILELNARPGLNIQIANGTGLRHRLRAVEECDSADDVTRRVAFSRRRFAVQAPPMADELLQPAV
ncbi:MAG: alpha-L-glutamate ligase-like protein [Gammaproteobacteria bacterium]|nr:alpha-L-glutamate ligase-like protein [Gammaproteobacteria bacterium]